MLIPRLSAQFRLKAAVVASMAAMVGVSWLVLQDYAGRAVRRAEVPRAVEGAAPALPNRPSIAVLAFRNLNEDPEEDYLSDGFSAELIRRLGANGEALVIARQSSFQYKDFQKNAFQSKGRAVKPGRVGRELGVAHLLDGAFRQEGGFLLVRARLLETASGREIWAESYQRESQHRFAIGDEIAAEVARRLKVTPPAPDPGRAARLDTVHIQAHDLFLRAESLSRRFEQGTNTLAIQLLRKAIGKDPRFARAMAALGWRYWRAAQMGWSGNRARAPGQAEGWARQALAIRPLSEAFSLLARIEPTLGRHDAAIAMAARAVALAPNDARAVVSLGRALTLAGLTVQAVPIYRRALRLAPLAPPRFLNDLGWGNFHAGQPEAALKVFDRLLAQGGKGRVFTEARLGRIAAVMRLGRGEEARRLAAPYREEARYSLKTWKSLWKQRGFKDPAVPGIVAGLLRRAGLPE